LKSTTLLAIVLGVATVLPAAAAADLITRFTVLDLTPAGSTGEVTVGLNALGQVIGNSASGPSAPFLYAGGSRTPVAGPAGSYRY
jgi:hypothetical protein